MAGELVALMPLTRNGSAEPGPGIIDRVRGAMGQRRLTFPCLAANPSKLAGVLLSSQGNPGPIQVNGQQAKPIWRRGNRLLFDPAPFRRFENIVSVGYGAGDPVLAPVVLRDGPTAGPDLAPGSCWRVQTLTGQDLGELAGPQAQPAPASSLLEGLARGLAAMIADNGDVWSFYDLATGSLRLPGWRWDTGIVLEALAMAAKHLSDASLLEAAQTVGERLLSIQTHHPECPGGFPEWTDLRYGGPSGEMRGWVAPFNAAFIAAGLIRLSEISGRKRYSQAATKSLRLACGKGLTPSGGLFGYFFEHSGQWKYLGQINDSGILGRGLGLLPDQDWAGEASTLAAGYILAKAARPDGHIGRAWWDPDQAAKPGPPLFPEWKRHPTRVVPKIFMRGQAWVLMGLTGTLRLCARDDIAEAGSRLAAFILAAQQADGSWLYSHLQPELGACAKTTAALALALAEWSAVSRDLSVLPAVRRAFGFLDSCRRPNLLVPELAHMPVDDSEEGCIIYFRNRPVVCAYAGALELLARLAVEQIP